MRKSVYQIFKEIESTTKKNEKVAIIKKNLDNQEFKIYLKFLYDKMITTGLSDKKINKKVKSPEKVDIPLSVVEVMEYLLNHNTGSDTDIQVVQNYIGGIAGLDSLEETIRLNEYTKFLKEVFTKTYKCGISASSVNKAFGYNYIDTFAIQASKGYEKYKHKFIGKLFYVTQKKDGVRCIAIKRSGNVTFFSRSGHEYEDLVEVKSDYMHPDFPDGVYDGEMLIREDNASSTLELFAKTKSIITRKGEKKNLVHHVFDYIPLDIFDTEEKSDTYTNRINFLIELFKKTDKNTSYCTTKLIPILYIGKDLSEVEGWYKYGEDKGWEGVMINLASAVYQFKRSDKILKYKYLDTADLLCIGVYEGIGEAVGTLGGIEMQYKDGSTVKSGSGFSAEDKDLFWKNPQLIVGSIIEVEHRGETVDKKTNLKSLRHPIFITVREDKTIEDIRYSDKE